MTRTTAGGEVQMDSVSQAVRVGPLTLAAGVSRMNLWTFLYASFICIGILAGMNFLQPYVLTEILRIPAGEQGAVSGDLGLWQEVIAIVLINPFGWLSDRIGRRPLMVFGIAVCGIGFGLYPFASSLAELTLYRVIFAVGASALAALIAIVANDYPAESSRGKMIGIGNLMNGLGVIFMTAVIAQIPAVARSQGFDPVTAGRLMFLIVMVLCLLSALLFRAGLKGGTPAARQAQPEWRVLMTSGLRAARNPRIALSYGAAFIGRADVSIKGMFISLWAMSAAPGLNIDPATAIGKAGQLLGIISVIGMAWALVFGYIMDRINRVTGMAIAMGLAGVGYSGMAWVTSPLDFSMLPWFIVLSIGQISAILASVTLVGQEAKPEERGAVVAMNGFFGAIGILLAFVIGGRLFDAIGPHAPFVMVGLLQLVLFVAAVVVRLTLPGAGRDQASG